MLFREWPGLQLCTTVQCLHIPPCSMWSKNGRNLSPSRRNYRSSGNRSARRGAELPCYCGRLVRTCWFWHLLRRADTRSFSSPFATPLCSVITYSITQVHLLPVPFLHACNHHFLFSYYEIDGNLKAMVIFSPDLFKNWKYWILLIFPCCNMTRFAFSCSHSPEYFHSSAHPQIHPDPWPPPRCHIRSLCYFPWCYILFLYFVWPQEAVYLF